MKTIKIHVGPGVDARAVARDLLKTGAVGIDDMGENLHDVARVRVIAIFDTPALEETDAIGAIGVGR